jgi:ribosomal-protein-alanine N-acetyltransferase
MNNSCFPTTFPRLETTRLVLRGITQEDAPEIFKNFSDPEITKWFFEEPLTELIQVQEIIAKFNQSFTEMNGLTWAIILRENGEFIGTCGYDNLETSHHGEIGFDLSKDYWGKGLMTEALSAILDYGFAQLDFSRVEADIFSNNLRAKRVLEKLGFHLVGVSKDLSYFYLSR